MVSSYLVPWVKVTGLPAGPASEDADAYHGGGLVGLWAANKGISNITDCIHDGVPASFLKYLTAIKPFTEVKADLVDVGPG